MSREAERRFKQEFDLRERIDALTEEAIASASLNEGGGRITAKQIVDEQAEDPGLWFEAKTAPEAYLQAALRRLHDAVEGGAVTRRVEGWRPIDTAPDDGSRIIIGWWNGTWTFRAAWWDDIRQVWTDDAGTYQPTHWHKRLPPPPAEGRKHDQLRALERRKSPRGDN